MPQGEDFHWKLSTTGVLDSAQPDPDASLGGNRSSTTLYAVDSALTSAMTDETFFVDTSVTSGVDAGDYGIFLKGAAALETFLVEAFDGGSSTYTIRKLAGTSGNLASSGDTYRIFKPNNLWSDPSSELCAAGQTAYRGLFVHNETGSTLTNVRFYFSPLSQLGSPDWRMARDSAVATSMTAISDEEEEPDLSGFVNAEVFEERFEYDAARAFGSIGSGPGGSVPIWLERTLPVQAEPGDAIVLGLVMEADNTGGDPDPFVSIALVVFTVTGITEQLEALVDRAVHVKGGGRIIATLTAAEDGSPLVGRFMDYAITSGPGGGETIVNDPNGQVTDENGEDSATLISPTDSAYDDTMATVLVREI